MRWQRGRSAPDVIDQRGRRGGRALPVAGGGGIVGLLVVVLVTVLGGGSIDPRLLEGAVPAQQGEPLPASQDPDKDLRDFTAYVFTEAQDFWSERFRQSGEPYARAKLVLFREGVSTGCGSASSAVGPFYCPADGRAYVDLTFYEDMQRQLGAGGDFAWAYVIAHELGHHVQRELGTSRQVQEASPEERDGADGLSVRLELQADCYAGVWGRTVFSAGDLEGGDLEEAIGASEAIGDDRLQRRAGGTVDPDSFTHGTSEQRRRWWRTGFDSGDPASCNTFA
jgi:uncharacterized protein